MRESRKKILYVPPKEPQQEKIRDSVMLARVITSAVIIVLCLAAMSISAYAHFSCNAYSNVNRITAANFDADVLITITNSNNQNVEVTKNGKTKTAQLAAGDYTVKLSKGQSTSKTGFCIITIKGTDYYISQIGVDVEKDLVDAYVEFTLKVKEDTKIEILSHWGTSRFYGYTDASSNALYIENGDTVDLTASASGNEETSSVPQQNAPNVNSTTSSAPDASESSAPASGQATQSTQSDASQVATSAPSSTQQFGSEATTSAAQSATSSAAQTTSVTQTSSQATVQSQPTQSTTESTSETGA